MTDLSTVHGASLEWMWPNRIPRGKITLIAGDGGVGKSFLTLAIASVVSRGGMWPDDPTVPAEAGDAILLSAEDDLEDTVVPRLTAMDADLTRIAALGTAKASDGKLSPFTLRDIDRLEQVMTTRPATRAIIIDPVSAYLGRGVDDHKNAELRGLLGPLADFAARHRVAILGVTHFNKAAGAKAAARVIGSVAYTNAARTAWAVAFDPTNEERRLFMPIKNNLSADRTSLAYTIAGGKVIWEREPLKLNANDVICGVQAKGPDRKEGRRKQAIAWLGATLAAGPLPSLDVIARAKVAGFGRDLIWEVKEAAGVVSKKQGKDGPWFWSLETTGGGEGADPAYVSALSNPSPSFSALHNTPESFRILQDSSKVCGYWVRRNVQYRIRLVFQGFLNNQ